MDPVVLVPFEALGDDPIEEARLETLREAKQLLAEWERSRDPVCRGRLLGTLECLRLLVAVDR